MTAISIFLSFSNVEVLGRVQLHVTTSLISMGKIKIERISYASLCKFLVVMSAMTCFLKCFNSLLSIICLKSKLFSKKKASNSDLHVKPLLGPHSDLLSICFKLQSIDILTSLDMQNLFHKRILFNVRASMLECLGHFH